MSSVVTEVTPDEITDEQYRQIVADLVDGMYKAAEEGDLDTVKYLVTEMEMDVEDGHYLLEAAEYNQPHVVEYLIEQGANVNIKDGWLLCYAAGHGYLGIVKLLISHGLDIGSYGEHAMGCAIDEGRLSVVKYLYSLGMRSCSEIRLHFAAEKSHWGVVKFLLSQSLCDNIRESVLKHAIQDGRLDIITLLYARGIELSRENMYNLLQDVIQRGRYNTVKVLWKDDMMEYWMPGALLKEAIQYGRFDIVRFLIREEKVKLDIDHVTTALSYTRNDIANYLFDEIYDNIPWDVENGKTRRLVYRIFRDRRIVARGVRTTPTLSELVARYW